MSGTRTSIVDTPYQYLNTYKYLILLTGIYSFEYFRHL